MFIEHSPVPKTIQSTEKSVVESLFSHGTLEKEDTPQILFQKVYGTVYTYSINGLKKATEQLDKE